MSHDSMESPIFWVGETKQALHNRPKKTKNLVIFALYLAQHGSKHPQTVQIGKVGVHGCLDLLAMHDNETQRCLYYLRYPDAVYVLHYFQKKSLKPINPPAEQRAIADKNLEIAKKMYEEKSQGSEMTISSETLLDSMDIQVSTGRMVKSMLCGAILNVAKNNYISPDEEARKLGINGRDYVDLMSGHIDRFNIPTLMAFLNRLGQNVHIQITPSDNPVSETGTTKVTY